MYSYDFKQWLLFFFIYCFLGWVWESCYVSVKQKKWVNRGFMRGPFLPIYGSGAITILIATIPVKFSPVLVYICGLLGATILEFFTGVAMEKLFHVRYWDYSYQKFNYKGHICLTSSIAWGFFSLAMIYGIHKPIESLVLSLPQKVIEIGTTVLAVIIAGDFSVSFKTAMELRDILDSIDRMKDEMKRLQKRAEVYEAFLSDSAEKRIQELEDKRDEMVKRGNELVNELQEKVMNSNIGEELVGMKDEFTLELSEVREKITVQLQLIRSKQKNPFENLMSSHRKNSSIQALLSRNPGAVSDRYAEALKEYKELISNHKNKKENYDIMKGEINPKGDKNE